MTPPATLSSIKTLKRVMVVDDVAINLKLMALMLAEMGCVTDCQSSGIAALDGLRRYPADLILLDIDMPRMDGFSVAARIKSDPRLQHIPIIFLSALDGDEDKVRGFQAGGVDFITKPFYPEEVRARVATHLHLSALQARLEEQNCNLEKIVDDQVRQIADAQMATIFALARLAESRDPETGEHLDRVMAYCHILVRALSQDSTYGAVVDQTFVHNVTQASILHDIGKVAIPDAVLLKPGRFTPEERKIMEKHTLTGAATLESVLGQYPHNIFIRTGIDIARAHHERWNGSGYPLGLAGAEIPLSARIMAIADVYDALRSQRCYKKCWSHEEACQEIVALACVEFDPGLVNVFRCVAAEFEVSSEQPVRFNREDFFCDHAAKSQQVSFHHQQESMRLA